MSKYQLTGEITLEFDTREQMVDHLNTIMSVVGVGEFHHHKLEKGEMVRFTTSKHTVTVGDEDIPVKEQ